MNTTEVVNVREPSAEKLVCPALGFKDLKTQNRVIVNGVDYHLHQVDAVRLGTGLFGVDHRHGQLHEHRDILVDVATQVEHEGLCEFTATDTIDTADFVITEDILHHSDDGTQISWVLDQHVRAVGDIVVQGWEHV